MKQPDQRVIRALLALRASNEAQTVLDWLRESLDELDRANRRACGDRLVRGQGEALCLERIIEVAAEADRLIQR